MNTSVVIAEMPNTSSSDSFVFTAIISFIVFIHYTIFMKNGDQVKRLEARVAALEEYVKTRSEDLEDSLEIVKDTLPEVIGAAIQTAAETLTNDLVTAKVTAERATLRIELLEKPILTALENAMKARTEIEGLLRQIDRVGQVDKEIGLLSEGKRHLLLEKQVGFYNLWRPEQENQFAPERWKTFI